VMPGMDGGDLLEQLNALDASIKRPLPVVVSAYDSDNMHELAKQLGVHHFLPKPVLPESLRSLVGTLTGHVDANTQGYQDQQGAIVLQGMRVLLVEDNPINQQLAVELLRSQGVEVQVANNGQEALTCLDTQDPRYYQVVLMDLQMPVMDGYEATRRLRNDPRFFTLPIIAMTAHAMAEERERCRTLGMNDHVSKPIEPEHLYATLGRFYQAPANVLPSTAAESSAPTPAVPAELAALAAIPGLDLAQGLRRTGNNATLYRQLLDQLTQECHQFLTTARAHPTRPDWPELMRQAHTLKGLTGSLGLGSQQPSLATLEELANRQDPSCTPLLQGIEASLTPLLTALEQALAGTEAPPAPTSRAAAPLSGSGNDAQPPCLATLRQLLAEGDSEAADRWEQWRPQFAQSLPPQTVERISTALANFEFETALGLLPKPPQATSTSASS
ncbi:MAG TPA: response regulator, partial [Azospira sp.]|nr:response regulator [Azospira sp.]